MVGGLLVLPYLLNIQLRPKYKLNMQRSKSKSKKILELNTNDACLIVYAKNQTSIDDINFQNTVRRHKDNHLTWKAKK